jgi:alkaline phosphatase
MVSVSAIGVGSEQFTGYYDNTDIFRKIVSVMTPKQK